MARGYEKKKKNTFLINNLFYKQINFSIAFYTG